MNREKNLIGRREALKRLAIGAAGAAMLNPMQLYGSKKSRNDNTISAPAKAVIQIWMWGGPSHLDTFDPKPDAGYDYCGPLNRVIATKADGIQISDQLPLLAQQADKFSIIRSMTHGSNAHETASYIVQTGHQPGRLVYPSVGAVVNLFKGHEAGYKGVVPPYIVLTHSQGRFSEAGFLGVKYKPFCTGGDPSRTPFAVEGIVTKGISDRRQQQRRNLLHELNLLGSHLSDNRQFKHFDQMEADAYGMMFGDAKKVFDLSLESDKMRDRYGRNSFGQACLAARRLVEQGVPYITINYRGWDTHKQHFEIMKKKLPELDRGFSALLEDLAQRGLLDSTIVWWGGEFGRTPKVMWQPPWNGGRSHYCHCFSTVIAGGGFRGGQVIGKSDAHGMAVVDRPVAPHDVIGSIYEKLGIDPDAALPNKRGLKVKVIPSDKSTRLHEIM